jgi:hypothetical protein
MLGGVLIVLLATEVLLGGQDDRGAAPESFTTKWSSTMNHSRILP